MAWTMPALKACALLCVAFLISCKGQSGGPEAGTAPAPSVAPPTSAEAREPSDDTLPGPAARVIAEALAAGTASNPAGAAPANALAAASRPARYSVFGVKPDDTLNVRAAPDPKSEKVGAFVWNARDVRGTGGYETRGSELWAEVTAGAKTGWVNRHFLVEQREGGGCGDPQIPALADAFAAAVRARDGKRLSALVSPLRGLSVLHEIWNTRVRFKDDTLPGLFTSPTSYRWGEFDGSAEPIVGSFKSQILPGLLEVLGPAAQKACGRVLAGGSAGTTEWPLELGALTLFSFHRPDTGSNWRTWVLGIEYVDSKPYVAMLVQYHWEI